MIKNITQEELEMEFIKYMLFSSFGIILFCILIRPLFSNNTIPFFVQRRLSVTHEGKKHPIKDLSFDKLPAIIYQSYNNETHINTKLLHGINHNLLNTEEFNNYFFDAKDSRDFIESEYPDLLNIYDNLSNYKKNNLFIYCVLYVKGGVYFDINLKISKPLTQIFADLGSMVVFTDKSHKFIMSPPANPIFKELIDSHYTNNIKNLSSVLLNEKSNLIKLTIDSKNNIRNSITNEVYFSQIN